MKLRILSDLHLECDRFNYEYKDEDVVIFAGDIATQAYKHELLVLLDSIPKHIKKVFVPGNHEFYGSNVVDVNEFFYELHFKYPNFIYLNDDATPIIHNNKVYLFYGGMMCSDFKLYRTPLTSAEVARTNINDFYIVKTDKQGRFKWSIEDHLEKFRSFNKFFDMWASNGNVDVRVCISHFLPTPYSINPKFFNDDLNPYFCSNQEERIGKVDLWIHGHTHCSNDYFIDNTRIVSNPKGYRNENANFNKDLVIEI